MLVGGNLFIYQAREPKLFSLVNKQVGWEVEALFLLLGVLGGDDGHDLVLDLGHLAVDGADDLVD